MTRRLILSGLATSILLVAAGCSSANEDSGSSDEAVSNSASQCGSEPCVAKTDFEQAGVCDKLFAGHAEIRSADLEEGILRWKCGDVDGVVQPSLGQEYCEYHAVAIDASTKSAAVVDNSGDLAAAKSKVVQCVYTSVYADVSGDGVSTAGGLMVKDTKTAALDKSHAADVAAALGVKSIGALATVSAPDDNNGKTVTFAGRPASGMYGQFNSRGAATALIHDCSVKAVATPSTGADRAAACFRASKAANAKGDSSKSAALSAACLGVNLATDANWAKVQKLGVAIADPKDDASYQNEKDISACIRTSLGGGLPWRNSDPTICARSLRAAAECGTTFAALPDKPGFIDGFEMTGWNGKSLEGTGCKYVKVAGDDYHQLVVCTPPADEIDKAITRTHRPLQQVCNDLFGNVVAMQAPIGAVATTKTADDKAGGFCGSFNKGAAAIKAAIAKSQGAAAKN